MSRNTIIFSIIGLAVILALVVIRIWLQGVPPAIPSGRLDPTPQPLNFGQVYVGQTAHQTVTYTNNSTQNATIISAGTADNPFGFEAASFTAKMLAPGNAMANLEFSFRPRTKGVFNGRGQIVRQPPGPQVNKVNLTGEGIYSESHGDLTINDSSGRNREFIDFDDVIVGRDRTDKVTVSNLSQTTDINVRVLFGGMSQAYSVTSPGPRFTIPKSSFMEIEIRFAPLRRTTYNSFIIVEYMRTPTIPSSAHYTGMMLTGRGIGDE